MRFQIKSVTLQQYYQKYGTTMKHYTTSAALLAAAALTASCGSSKKLQAVETQPTGSVAMIGVNETEEDLVYLMLSDAQRDMVKGNNAFALQLFHQMSGQDSKVVSPISVAYLMGMLANGADGNTCDEILKAIGCEGIKVEDLNALYKELLLKAGRLDRQTTVSIANYIAVNRQYKLRPAFVEAMKDCYQAGVESMDFSHPSALKRINGWCAKQTNGMIPSIIDQTEPSAVSYLLNAIYFNGTWEKKFKANATREENFRGYTRNIQKVEMMHQQNKFQYAEMPGYRAVTLPYGNGTYCMTVLLPDEDKSISDMMAAIDVQALDTLYNKMETCKVNLKLPKFTTETKLPLNNIISALGAPDIFNPSTADFSKFADGRFFVSQMLQKAKIEVSEEGTKAAAVTAAVMLTSAAPMEYRRVEFIADRPFVYTISDRQSGALLFIGQFTGNE